jgi:hypothetical protein
VASFDHEILVELFRHDGGLAVELLRACAGIVVDHARVEQDSIDLSQVAPTEYRADAVVTLRDAAGRAVAGVIVEVQRQPDRDKLRTWPVYVTALRAKLDCAVVLLVIAPDPEVAVWAQRPIELGHPGFQLTPVVVGFDDVPWVRDRAAASRLPELAVLSVLAHPELEIAEVALEAISRLPEDQAKLYFDVILTALPAAHRQILEAQMQAYEYQSEFARKYYGQGLEDGREEGREAGRKEGREAGREEGLRAAAVALARAKLDGLSVDDVTAIQAMCDQRAVTALITALGQAVSYAEARTVLDRALAVSAV